MPRGVKGSKGSSQVVNTGRKVMNKIENMKPIDWSDEEEDEVNGKKSQKISQRTRANKKVIVKSESEYEEDDEEEEGNDLERKIERAMSKVMGSFKKEINMELREFEKSMNFNSGKIDEFLVEMKELREKQAALEKENYELRRQVKSMAIIIEDLDQYSRNRNIQIDNVPEEQDEDLKEMVINVGKKLDVEIETKEIDAIHRLPTTRKESIKPIVVQFTTRQVRENIMSKRKTKITTRDLKMAGEEKIVYINEHLTRNKKSIMFEARKLKNEKGYKFLWTRNGKIFIRKEERSHVIELRCIDDLEKIV
uniref:FP protein C-terminal domain-containing protein n=1 Tax=Cacopsylla melanoneura TaxID=428564 RepID=A0A8D8Y1M0_9HEMI